MTQIFPRAIVVILLLSSFSLQSELDDVATLLKNSNTKMETECFAKEIFVPSLNQTRTMDVIKMVPLDENNKRYIGAFHVCGVGPTGHSVTYLVSTETGPCGDWKVETELNNSASMGFLYKDPKTTHWYLAFELEGGGNRVAIRKYQKIEDVYANKFVYEYQLLKKVHIADSPNTFSHDAFEVVNIGTPSIEKIEGDLMHIKFHYYPNGGPNDLPATGYVNLRDTDTGVFKDYSYWYGHFDNYTNNAIRIAGGLGKIGGRDSFVYNDKIFHIYEAQLSDDPNGDSDARWASWRIFLHSDEVEPERAILLDLVASDDKIVDFANPHVAVGGGKFVFYGFIPGQGDHFSKLTGDYLRVFDWSGKGEIKRILSKKTE